MKYPIVNVAYLPRMHKSFSKPIVMHFDGTCQAKDDQLQAYCKHLLKLATKKLADNFILNQGVAIENTDGYFVLCKDNLDILMMKGMAAVILEELKEVGKANHIEFVFGYAKSMLIVEGYTMGMFASNQIGKDFLESDEYLKSTKESYKKTRVYVGHFLPTYEEFQKETTNFST